MGVGQRVPFGLAAQALQLRLAHIGHGQIGVQRARKSQRLLGVGVGVVHLQADAQRARGQINVQLQLKSLWPPGAGLGAVVQVQREAGMPLTQLGCTRLPGQVAGKAVFRQRIVQRIVQTVGQVVSQGAALVKLRKTHWHAAANGGLAVHGALRAEVQALLATADPRQHMRAVQSHHQAVSVRQTQFASGQAREHGIAASGLNAH